MGDWQFTARCPHGHLLRVTLDELRAMISGVQPGCQHIAQDYIPQTPTHKRGGVILRWLERRNFNRQVRL